MPLSLRAALLSFIAVPTALSAPAHALPERGEEAWKPGAGSTVPAVPRQVLLIDLNPVLGPALGNEAFEPLLEHWSRPFPESDDSMVPPAVPNNTRPQPFMRSQSQSHPVQTQALSVPKPAAQQFASQLAPQLAAPSPATYLPAPKKWEGPFPSLGQPQLDRQLRRYLAYLDTTGRPDLMIVGGQGAAQGIDPLALQASLGDRGYGDLKVFNWGLSESSAQTVEWLLTALLTPQQLPQLVIWADASPALNGDRPDLAFSRIQASPGQRLLAAGQRPSLSVAEKASARRLGQILSSPVRPALPETLVTLARSLQSHPQNSIGGYPEAQSLGRSASNKSNSKAHNQQSPINDAEAAIAQAAPVLIDSRTRVLPILRPQQPQPVVPAASSARDLSGRDQSGRDHLTPDTGASRTASRDPAQSAAGGFRLVNWCRSDNGPCQPADDLSFSERGQPVPAWLRQTQAAQEALKQKARLRSVPQQVAPSQQTALPKPSAASLTARRSQISNPASNSASQAPVVPSLPPLTLPAWSQSPAAQQLSQALGFQSVAQQLAPGATSRMGDRPMAENFSLQGRQNRALHRLAQFSQQQGMAIAFVPLPLSQQAMNRDRYRQEQSFRTYLEVAAQMTPLSLIELPGQAMVWQDALFAQPDRLNRYGAAVLGWQIGQTLDETVLQQLR